LPEQIPSELAKNQAAYQNPQAVDDFSFYRLFPEEDYLFRRYYKRGESLLDVACGLGRTTLLLHEMGMDVRGVDCSEIFIQTANRRLPYLDLRIGSFDNIEEPDASYSHVLLSFNGIDCAFPATHRAKAISECVRVLKPGGTFIYSSHNLKSLHWFSPYYRNRLLWKFRNMFRAFKEWDYVLEEGVHMFYASYEFVVAQTEEMGLKLLETRSFSRFRSERIDRYFSPYIYYAFFKPLE
jgi:ubiquinone/menaquinone biosynthesis C-methylase UbiE